jgi:hypothetical protein
MRDRCRWTRPTACAGCLPAPIRGSTSAGANPHVAFSGVVMERLTAAFGAQRLPYAGGRRRRHRAGAHEMARWTCPACIESLGADVSYLAAAGLPLRFRRHARLGLRLPRRAGRSRCRRPTWCWCTPAPATWRACSQRRAARPMIIGGRPPGQHDPRLRLGEAAGPALHADDLRPVAGGAAAEPAAAAHRDSLAGTADRFLGACCTTGA